MRLHDDHASTHAGGAAENQPGIWQVVEDPQEQDEIEHPDGLRRDLREVDVNRLDV
jgi:hypothetical protein